MATFDKAVRYEVTAVTETPLRTGPSDGSIDRVLRHRDGQAFLQAASLAGALRGWLEKQDKNAANALFGSQEKFGQLIVSDMEIKGKAVESAEDTTIQLRPRLRINGKMGSAADGGKFDVAHIARGTVMKFSLTWLGAESDTDGPAQIEQMLGALHAGEIRLGAQKSNGFGRVALTVRSQIYHMTDKADREAWLQDEFDGQTLELPEICTESVCTFTVNGVADSILIKSSVPRVEYDENNTRKEIIQNIKENGTAVLPGSSVKGAVRARVQAIADLLHCSESVDELFGRGAAQGDNGIAGRVQFTDVVLDKLRQFIRIAEKHDIVLLHENEKGIYGDTGARCKLLFDRLACPHFKAAFDFANFVQCEQDTAECWELLHDQIAYIHIKDALPGCLLNVPAGTGLGKIPELLRRAFCEEGYHGFLTLEPHLAMFDFFAPGAKGGKSQKLQFENNPIVEKMKSEMAEPGRPKDGAEAYATQYHALVEILNPILN